MVANAIDPSKEGNLEKIKGDKYRNIIQLVCDLFENIYTRIIDDKRLDEDFSLIHTWIYHLSMLMQHRTADSESRYIIFQKLKVVLEQIIEESGKVEGGFMVADTAYHFMMLLQTIAG